MDIQNGRYVLKDSGARQDFDTGSRRDTRQGKGRYDLIPWGFIRELAELYEAGGIKYGDRNWEKGQPLSRYFDSAIRHLERWQDGLEDENHLLQAAWNIIAIWWTQKEVRAGRLPSHLGDYGPLAKDKQVTEQEVLERAFLPERTEDAILDCVLTFEGYDTEKEMMQFGAILYFEDRFIRLFAGPKSKDEVTGEVLAWARDAGWRYVRFGEVVTSTSE